MRTLLLYILSISASSCFYIKMDFDHNETIDTSISSEYKEAVVIPQQIDTQKSASLRRKRQTVNDAGKLWPNGIIVYTFDNQWPDEHRAMSARSSIARAMKHWTDVTCLKFIPRTAYTARDVGHNDYITFTYGSICSSEVGRRSNNQKLIIGDACLEFPMSIAHELAHVAGFYHEHTRPDRDQYVTVNFDNIADDHRLFYMKRSTADENTKEPYDIESVMHYGPHFFSKYPGSDRYAIQPKDNNLFSSMGQRDYLSFLDVKTMNDVYKCNRRCHTTLQCKNGGYIGPRCMCICPYGLTGSDCTDVSRSSSGCGGVLRGRTGRFTSPGFPGEYPNSTICTWLIEGPPGSSITLTFSQFDFERPKNDRICRQDYLEIKIYGPTVAGPRFCQYKSPKHFHYNGTSLYIKFKSNEKESYSGFNASYIIN